MPRSTATGRAPRARKQGRHRSRVGLALAGGGPLGGIYEVGALLALADSLDGIDFGDLDVYVGVSSGGFVAAALANGISPAQMYRLFIDDGADAALTPEVFLRPAFSEFAHRAALVPGLVARATLQCAAGSVPAGHDGVAGDAVARGADRHVRQPVDRPVSAAAVRRFRAHQRFPPARPQALPRRDQPRHRRLGDVRRPGARARADLQGDRGLGGVAGPVSAGPDRQRVLRRRRAQQDAARIGRARRRHRSAPLRQSAGAVRRERGHAQRPHHGRQAESRRDCPSCCRRRSAPSSIRG